MIIPNKDQIKSMQHAEFWDIDNDFSKFVPNHTNELKDENILL